MEVETVGPALTTAPNRIGVNVFRDSSLRGGLDDSVPTNRANRLTLRRADHDLVTCAMAAPTGYRRVPGSGVGRRERTAGARPVGSRTANPLNIGRRFSKR